MTSKRTPPPKIIQIASVKEQTPCFKMGKSKANITQKDSVDFIETESPYSFFPHFSQRQTKKEGVFGCYSQFL